MTLTVSPYLSAPQAASAPQSAGGTGAPQNTGPATSAASGTADSVSLSQHAQQALNGAGSPPDSGKTPLQSTLEMILASVKNSVGPTLTFRSSPAPNNPTGTQIDKSY
jgi:hypothetical protein